MTKESQDLKASRFSIGKLLISSVNVGSALKSINEYVELEQYGYICVTNSRTAYLSHKDDIYCKIQNNSILTVPDGIPLVWIAKNMGYKEVSKVSGISLMKEIFDISHIMGYSHYFYGCSQETIDKLQINLSARYPNMIIKGAISPPFQPLEKFDMDQIATQINKEKPTFFWCGLGAPKQEKFISALQPKLEQTISIGVGLAFEYLADTVKQPPKLVNKLNLEWLYRIAQQPIKGRRFLVPFIWITSMLLKSIFNKK